MGENRESERIGIGSGNGMVMGAAVGIVFAPLFEPFGMVLGAAVGLVVGASLAHRASP